MEPSKYKALKACLNTTADIQAACKTHRVSYQTALSILSQKVQKTLKKDVPYHHKPQNASSYYKRWKSGQTIYDIASTLNFPPVPLARIILAQWLLDQQRRAKREKPNQNHENGEITYSAAKKKANALLKQVGEITDARLQSEVIEALQKDDCCSPHVAKLRHWVGKEFEFLLEEKLASMGIAFTPEEVLREKGYPKTPDIMLEPVPIVVKRFVVNWIESKALFGDAELHKGYLKDQLNGYRNRYGPGLVIYWFGYELSPDMKNDKDILVMDHFPLPEDIVTINFGQF